MVEALKAHLSCCTQIFLPLQILYVQTFIQPWLKSGDPWPPNADGLLECSPQIPHLVKLVASRTLIWKQFILQLVWAYEEYGLAQPGWRWQTPWRLVCTRYLLITCGRCISLLSRIKSAVTSALRCRDVIVESATICVSAMIWPSSQPSVPATGDLPLTCRLWLAEPH